MNEPTMEECGLNSYLYKKYGDSFGKLEKRKRRLLLSQEFLWLLFYFALWVAFSFISSIISPTVVVVGYVAFFCICLSLGFATLVWFFISKLLKEKISELEKEIQPIEEKLEPFETALENYHKNRLRNYFESYLFYKRSDTERFKIAFPEFVLMVGEAVEINKFLITKKISLGEYTDYLKKRLPEYFTQKINGKQEFSVNRFERNNESKSSFVETIKSDLKKAEIQKLVLPAKNPIFYKKLEMIKDISKSSFVGSIKNDIKNERMQKFVSPEKLYFSPRKIDWDEINKKRNITGLRGEEIVLAIEQDYLKSIGREDLANKVRHLSVEIGDGLGYDVLSFFDDGREKYIEVKSTAKSTGTSFYLSRNELEFLKSNKNSAYLYNLLNVNEYERIPFLKVYSAMEVVTSKQITPVKYLVKMN